MTTLIHAFFRRFVITLLVMIACILLSTSLRAQNSRSIVVGDGVFLFETRNSNVEKRYGFGQSSHDPEGDLFRDSNGIVWGTAQSTDEYGALYQLASDGLSVSYVHFFRKTDGAQPKGKLAEAAGKLWGTTSQGGVHNTGVIFTINLDGSGFAKVHDFSDATGSYPGKNLVLSNGRIWGVTNEGGAEDGGVIFSMATNGSDYQVEHDFYIDYDAGYPEGGLIAVGNKLWGLTRYGGDEDYGAIFSIHNDGTNYQLQHSFESSSTDGGSPFGDLVELNGTLWGLTSEDGASGYGTLFRIQSDGSGYSVAHMFLNTDGGTPLGSLTVSNNKLWGTTATKAGASGTVFSFNTSTSSLQTVHTFTGSNGALPKGGLLNIDGVLWGVTSEGGLHNRGTVFHIDNSGSNFASAYSFDPWPVGAVGTLLEFDGKLWGMSLNGGANNTGTIYTLDRDGKNLKVVHSFGPFGSSPEGTLPRGGLIEKDGMLYGLTNVDGANNKGTMFKLDPGDNSVTTVYSFSDGGFPYPQSGLFYRSCCNFFYGILAGKDLFRIQPDGTNFQIITTLPGIFSDISLLSDDVLYGTERTSGQVFSFDASSEEYVLIKDFNSTFDNSTQTPPLNEYQGVLYGITHKDGSNSLGTVFRVDEDGANFTNLHDFNGTEGHFPIGKLHIQNDAIYGMTRSGGANGKGVLYKLNTDGSNFEVLRNFDGTDQRSPVLGNFATPKYAPIFLAEFPDIHLQEGFDAFKIDLTQYVYDADDDIADMTVFIDGTGSGKSYVGTVFTASPNPVLSVSSDTHNFGTSVITVKVKDKDNNEITTDFTITISPVADGLSSNAYYRETTYPDMTEGFVISASDTDKDDNGVNSVTHLQLTSVTGGKIFLNNGTTEVAVNGMVPLTSATLRFKPTVSGSGSFKLRGATGPNLTDVGGPEIPFSVFTSPVTPVITWTVPSSITYGESVTSGQLPSADVPGTFATYAFKSGSPSVPWVVGAVLKKGTYTVQTIFTPTDQDNYYSDQAVRTLMVNKASLTVTAEDKSVAYGTYPGFTATYVGFVNGDGPAQLPYQPQMQSSGSGSGTGTYDIDFSDVPNPANYSISTVSGTLTVTKAPLTISVANATRAYGAADPSFQLTYTGLTNYENSSAIDTPPTITTTGVVDSPVGTYPIQVSGASDANYDISYVGAELTISKKTIEVWVDPVNKKYGEVNPALVVKYQGLIDGDTKEDIDVAPVASTTATTLSNCGTYEIVLNGGSDNNYTLNLNTGFELNIYKKPISVYAENATTTYGTLPSISLKYEGFINGDGPEVIDVPPQYSTSVLATSTPRVYGQGISNVSSGSDNNYAIAAEYYASVEVRKAPLQVKAVDQSVTHGDAIPAPEISYTGFVNGDRVSKLALPGIETSATATSDAGVYPITLSGGSSSLYELTLVDGSLTINKRQAVITLSNLQQTYNGGQLSTGVTTDPEGLNVTLTYNGMNTNPVAPGTYEVNAMIDDVNFHGESVDNLVIQKAALQVKVNDVSIVFGSAIPSFTIAYTGFVGDDDESKIIPSVATTTASATSHVGTYPIKLSDGSSSFYDLTLTEGTLTIASFQATVELTDLQQLFTGKEISVGVVTTPAGLPVTVTYNSSPSKPVQPGTYEVKVQVSDGNYAGEATGTLVISAITGISETSEQLTIVLYPNPVVDSFSFSGALRVQSLRVYNLQGKLIIDNTNLESGEQINMASSASGTYLVIIDHNGKRYKQKIIKP